MKYLQDTIAAQATVSGEGGIAIIRISGENSREILMRVFKPVNPEMIDRRLSYGHVIWENDVIDEVMAVVFSGKHTYTAENMAEIQCHGSQYIVTRILSILTKCGARIAEPGEFTYRAFVNGRIDLTQAESVMRMIHVSNERARKSAVRQMEGVVSASIAIYKEQILDIAAALSAYIDFPDEVDETETAEMIYRKCNRIQSALIRECNLKKGRIEDDGIYVVLCGKPNAGKSSLMNVIVGSERAIVTDIPGTTRDTISETVMIDGIRFTITDTAGLRETENIVEKIGVERAQKAIETADIRLLLVDGSEKPGEEVEDMLAEINPDLILISKEDISPSSCVNEIMNLTGDKPSIQISVPTGAGIDSLEQWLVDQAEKDLSENGMFSQARHVESAIRAAEALASAAQAIKKGMPLDLVNIDLLSALDALGEITGENASENVIDRVFNTFCVGK